MTELAADAALERDLLESKEDTLIVGQTAAGGDIVVLGGDDPVVVVRDPRGRNIAHIRGAVLLELHVALEGVLYA